MGALLDTFQGNLFPDVIDPVYTLTHPNEKVYWSFDVSRAVHPKVILQECPNPNGILVNNRTTSTEACVLYDGSKPLPQEKKLLTNDTNLNQEFLEVLYSFNEGLLGVD